jgi:hypothetical protein
MYDLKMIKIILFSAGLLIIIESIAYADKYLAPPSLRDAIIETSNGSPGDYFAYLYRQIHDKAPELFEYIRRYKSDAYYSDMNAYLRRGHAGFIEWLTKAGRPLDEILRRTCKPQFQNPQISAVIDSSVKNITAAVS